jgi:heavy metal translocating P-type ATPase
MNTAAAMPALPTEQESVLFVEGMHCGSCAAAVEMQLKRHPGVINASVSFAADTAMVRWNTEQTSLPGLQKAVSRLGYQLHTSESEQTERTATTIRKRLQWRLAVAAVFGMWSMMAAFLVYLAPLGIVEPEVTWPLALASGIFALPVLTYSGSHFYKVGWRTLRVGAPGLDTLITVAVVAASIISIWRLLEGQSHVYFDASVMLITFQLIARLLDHNVRRHAAEVVRSYLNEAPEQATAIKPGGDTETRPAKHLKTGQTILLTTGQHLALDGRVTSGKGYVDLSMMTGESTPQLVGPGNQLFAGSVLIEGDITLRVTAEVGQRRIDNLAQSIRGLLSRKTALQLLTDRIARVLLPIILIAATAAIVLALFQGVSPLGAAARGLAVMIVTCPCALSLAIPLVVIMGHAHMTSNGIVFQDPAALETAADVNVIVFDKTGTLTSSHPTVATVTPDNGWSPAGLLQLAINTLQDSPHPIARGLALEGAPTVDSTIGQREATLGHGTRWQIGKSTVLAGRATWLKEQGVELPITAEDEMTLHLAYNNRHAGKITFKETLRPEAIPLIQTLKRLDLPVYLLSGDTRQSSLTLAHQLGIDSKRVIAEATPEQKCQFIQNLEQHYQVAFVGDGLNDGLALASARLGIAVHSASTSASSAAAVYLPDGLANVPATLQFAHKARKLMRENLAWALVYNGLALPMAIAGLVQPVVAAIAMTLSSLCVLLNSMRMQRMGDTGKTPTATGISP